MSDKPRVINFPGPSANDAPKDGWKDRARGSVEALRIMVEEAIAKNTPIAIVSVAGINMPSGESYTTMMWANVDLPGAIGLTHIAVHDSLNNTDLGRPKSG